MTIFSPHMPFTELADLADEYSTASPEGLLHLAECSHCSAQLQTIRQTTSLMRSDAIENAPTDVVKYAKGIFRQRAANWKTSALTSSDAAVTGARFNAALEHGLRS